MKYKIEHISTFQYDAPVDQSLNHIRLKPKTDECQRLLSYQCEITPHSLVSEYTDFWRNHVQTFFIPEKHDVLEVKTTSMVSIQRSPFIRMIHFSPEIKKIFHSELFRQHYLTYLNETEYTYLTQDQLECVLAQTGDLVNPIQFSLEVMRYLHQTIAYDHGVTTVYTKAQEAFELKRGVCQDFAHIMLGILRAKGIPSRYISGYIYVGENSALVGDAATHAWVEVMVPGIGWVGLDPTNNVEALEQHIRVGSGRDYGDVSPLQGVFRGGGQTTLNVKVGIHLLEER
jgi:transglutaminase-like putative cysteine protease